MDHYTGREYPMTLFIVGLWLADGVLTDIEHAEAIGYPTS